MAKFLHRHQPRIKKKDQERFERYFFKLINDFVFGKIIKNVRSLRDIKSMTHWHKRNKLVSGCNYHARKCCSENLLATNMNKISVKLNKAVSISRFVKYIHKQDNHVRLLVWLHRPNYGKMAKLCFMDTDSFIVHVESENIYPYLAGDVKKGFDTLDVSWKIEWSPKATTHRKKTKNDRANERWIRWKNNGKTCSPCNLRCTVTSRIKFLLIRKHRAQKRVWKNEI